VGEYLAIVIYQNFLKQMNSTIPLQNNCFIRVPGYCRYLIDVRWLKLWKKYVGYDEWETGMVGEESANPGPIDNSNLLEGASSVFCY